MFVGIGVTGLLFATQSNAQTPQMAAALDSLMKTMVHVHPLGAMRLMVRPRTLTTATENPAAGEYPLDSIAGVIVTVPKQCVGAHRCPLLVFLPGAHQPSQSVTTWLRPTVDKYGMILLAPTESDPKTLDAALREALHRFAIDPDKIAIVGRCATGGDGVRYGIDNPDLFSRVVSISGDLTLSEFEGLSPQNKTTEFLLDRGFTEVGYQGFFPAAKFLRDAGHPVKVLVGLREHEDQLEDYDFLGHWLQASWATTPPAAPIVVADSLPVLTSDIMTRMTTFWANFLREPPAIRDSARRAHLHEVLVPVGTEHVSVWMMDMPALANAYPAVAVDLRKAGLTAQEHDAYRVAIVGAFTARHAMVKDVGNPDPTSAVAKNIQFVRTHVDEIMTLLHTGIEHPEKFTGIGGSRSAEKHHGWLTPEEVDSFGAMGFFRTP